MSRFFIVPILLTFVVLTNTAHAQATEPVWSAIMTVGVTEFGGHGYVRGEAEGGSLSDDDFEYSSTTNTVTYIEVDPGYGVVFRVHISFPDETTLTLEIDGYEFPFDDSRGGSSSGYSWEWEVPEGLSDPDNDLPIGGQVVVCLRTAAQECPTEVPSALRVADVSAEEGETLTFTVALSPPSTETVTVDWATSDGTATSGISGTDFTAGTGTLTFTAGDTEKTFTVATTEDVTDQVNETFTVTLSNATGAAISDATATGTIRDDDAPPFVWSTVMTVGETQYGNGYDVDEDEGGSLSDDEFGYQSATYTVSLVELDDSYGVTLKVYEAGLPEKEFLTLEIDGHAFPFEDRTGGGEREWVWDVPVGLTNSDLPIGDRVVVCLRSATGVCPTEVPSALSVADVSAEEGETLTFTVALSPPSTETVTVDWATSDGTATSGISGTDFTAGTGTLTFTAGDTEKTFTVATTEDVTDQVAATTPTWWRSRRPAARMSGRRRRRRRSR